MDLQNLLAGGVFRMLSKQFEPSLEQPSYELMFTQCPSRFTSGHSTSRKTILCQSIIALNAYWSGNARCRLASAILNPRTKTHFLSLTSTANIVRKIRYGTHEFLFVQALIKPFAEILVPLLFTPYSISQDQDKDSFLEKGTNKPLICLQNLRKQPTWHPR